MTPRPGWHGGWRPHVPVSFTIVYTHHRMAIFSRPETQAAATAMLEAAGRRATATAPLVHVAMETDGAADGAALTARLWPRPRTGIVDGDILLARVDFHGRWITWRL